MVNFSLGKMLQMDYQYISAATHKRSVELFFVIPKPSRILCLVLSLFVSKAAICTYIIRNSEYFTISAAYITVRWPDRYFFGYYPAAMATALLPWLLPCCHGYCPAAMATALLPWLLPCCHGYCPAAMATALLPWLLPCCHGYCPAAMATALLPWIYVTYSTTYTLQIFK